MDVETENRLKETLKRCSPETVEAALRFQKSRDYELLPVIVLGIFERFIEPEARPRLREGGDSTRLFEDLGVDSLLMVEIVIAIEEALGVTIQNEEVQHLRTVGDLKSYLQAKVQGLSQEPAARTYRLEEVAALMPHQEPFLFIREVSLQADGAEGEYLFSGQEFFAEGHFRGNPVFPASLMMEALGQLAVFFLLAAPRPEYGGSVDPERILFASANGVRNHQPVGPGQRLQMSVTLKKVHAPLAVFEGRIRVDGQKVASAEEITLAFAVQGSSAASNGTHA